MQIVPAGRLGAIAFSIERHARAGNIFGEQWLLGGWIKNWVSNGSETFGNPQYHEPAAYQGASLAG